MDELNLTPDWYTKVLLNPDGSIRNADFLEPNDLPLHKHALDEIEGDFEGLIFDALSHFFVNNIDSAVVFNYDDKRRLITADLRYDGLTIDKNEDGELMSMGGGEGSGGISIPECVTHTHKHTDIEDWEEALKQYLDIHPRDVDISKYIDNTTIIVNNEGKLSAIGSGVTKHKHYIADIVDFPDIQPANVQPLNASELSYIQGAVDLTDLTIGHAIIAINYHDAQQDDRIDELAEQVNRISIQTGAGGSCPGTVKIDETALHKKLLNKRTGKLKDAYLNNNLSVLVDALPYASCRISMLVDGVEVETVHSSEIHPGYINGHFYIKEIKLNNTKIIGYYLNELSEGEHSLQFKYNLGETEDYSEKIFVNICNKKKFNLQLVDCNPIHTLNGMNYYDKDFNGTLELVALDYISTIWTDPGLFLGEEGIHLFSVEDIKHIPETLKFENLFEISELRVPLDYEVEYSDSFVYENKIEAKNCYFVNNVVHPVVRGNLKFRVPNTKRSKGLKIWGLNNVVQLRVYKGNEYISKNELFNLNDDENKGGVVILEDNEDCLNMVFNNIYDSGKDDLVVYMDFVYPVDTTKVKVIPLK